MNKLSEFLDVFEKAFPGLRETVRLVVAVAATSRLERKQPLAVILVGGPSSGKTSVLMPITRGSTDSVISSQVLRVDDFSGASLVSHAANRNTEQLEKQDLLPKLKGKCVIVKEMAPMFTGHEDELMRKFGVLASVLDGEGYTSSSGSHGQRGYTDSIVFSLIGAVTPNVLTAKVLGCLDAIGPRFCFWEVPNRELDPNKWRGPDEHRAEIEKQATDGLTTFLDELFKKYLAGSVPRENFAMSDDIREKLSLVAIFMSSLRSRGMVDRDEENQVLGYTASAESPERVYRYLEQIVMGSALSGGRFRVSDQDLKLALGVAIGSASPSRRKTMKALVENPGRMTVSELSQAMKVNVDTASKYADYASKLGLIEKVNYDGTTIWDLKAPFGKLRHILNANLLPDDAAKALWEQAQNGL